MFKKWCITSVIFGLLPLTASAAIYLTPAVSYVSTKTTDITYQGFTPKLAIGIDNDFGAIGPNTFYIGAEVFGMPFKAFTVNDNSPTGDLSLKQNWSYGIDVLPGINFDGIILGYIILGMNRTSFSAGISTGKQGGVGLEYKATRRWAVRLNFIYTSYSSMTGLNSPKTEELTLGAVYRL